MATLHFHATIAIKSGMYLLIADILNTLLIDYIDYMYKNLNIQKGNQALLKCCSEFLFKDAHYTCSGEDGLCVPIHHMCQVIHLM